MDYPYPTIDQPATSEYILSVLCDRYRQWCQDNPLTDRDFRLTFDTTIADWCAAGEMYGWPKLGRAFNQIFGIHCSDSEWKTVLEPTHQKTLRDLCDFLVRYVPRPTIRPVQVLEKPCETAGAFLTVRSLLGQEGAVTEEIAPSTLLAPYTRRYWELFLGPISRLAPGILPPVRIRQPLMDLGGFVVLAGIVCLIVGGVSGSPLIMFASGVVCFVGIALTWIASLMLPRSVEFGTLRTFRDLSVVLAQENSVELEPIHSSSREDS